MEHLKLCFLSVHSIDTLWERTKTSVPWVDTLKEHHKACSLSQHSKGAFKNLFPGPTLYKVISIPVLLVDTL